MSNVHTPYPLSWPTGKPRNENPKQARFSKQGSGYSNRQLTVFDAVNRLTQETSLYTKVNQEYRINPDDIVISSNIQVKKDGTPYSNRRDPEDAGVVVYFELDGVPYQFPCDTYDRVADNIAAIAAHFGFLRGVERHGVGTLKEAFSGWAALPSPDQVKALSWKDVLMAHGCNDFDCVKRKYRALAKRHHPDHGGNTSEFQKINEAYKQAKNEYGVK